MGMFVGSLIINVVLCRAVLSNTLYYTVEHILEKYPKSTYRKVKITQPSKEGEV